MTRCAVVKTLWFTSGMQLTGAAPALARGVVFGLPDGPPPTNPAATSMSPRSRNSTSLTTNAVISHTVSASEVAVSLHGGLNAWLMRQ